MKTSWITYSKIVAKIAFFIKNSISFNKLLFSFWGLLLIYSSFMLRTIILEDNKDDLDINFFALSYDMLMFSFILSLISEKTLNKEKNIKSDKIFYP